MLVFETCRSCNRDQDTDTHTSSSPTNCHHRRPQDEEQTQQNRVQVGDESKNIVDVVVAIVGPGGKLHRHHRQSQ